MPNAHLRVQHGWCNSSGSLKGTVIEIVGKKVAHGDVQEEQKNKYSTSVHYLQVFQGNF